MGDMRGAPNSGDIVGKGTVRIRGALMIAGQRIGLGAVFMDAEKKRKDKTGAGARIILQRFELRTCLGTTGIYGIFKRLTTDNLVKIRIDRLGGSKYKMVFDGVQD